MLCEKDVRKDVLYFLSRSKRQYSVVLLSNNPRYLRNLDESTRSSLQPEYIHFDSYSAQEILDILKDRAETGLKTVDEAMLGEIARGQWSIENGNHYVRDRSYDEDRCQVRDPNSAQILATLRSLARFLAKQGVHRPSGSHQQTTPAFNRFCDAHRNQTIRWLMSPRGFK